MDFIDPSRDHVGRVMLAGLYPFLWGEGSYDYKAASALLKSECLLQKECILPGSLALENTAIQNLIKEHAELLRSGVFALGLRNTAKSFNDLAIDKFGSKAPFDVCAMADFLDETCSRVFQFNPSECSGVYKNHLMDYLIKLSERQQNGHATKSIMTIVGNLEKHDGYLSYSDAASMKTNWQAPSILDTFQRTN